MRNIRRNPRNILVVKTQEVMERLDKFVEGCKASYRNKDGKQVKIPTDLLALSITLELKRLGGIYGTDTSSSK